MVFYKISLVVRIFEKRLFYLPSLAIHSYPWRIPRMKASQTHRTPSSSTLRRRGSLLWLCSKKLLTFVSFSAYFFVANTQFSKTLFQLCLLHCNMHIVEFFYSFFKSKLQYLIYSIFNKVLPFFSRHWQKFLNIKPFLGWGRKYIFWCPPLSHTSQRHSWAQLTNNVASANR